MLHYAGFLAVPVAIFNGVALVVTLLTFSKVNFQFNPALFPVHGGGYDGVTLAVPRTNEAVYFALIKQ